MAPLTNIARSLLSQVHEESPNDVCASHELELESFQKQVADRFHDLSFVPSDELLSLQWVRKFLDIFLCCQEEFRVILFNNKAQLTKPPMDRLIGDFYERSVKALDVCNAIRDGIEQIRQWQKLLEIVLCTLARQLQAIGNNLTVPRGNEIVATNGLAIPVYTMGCVLLFVMWALVAAIPCQDRGLQVPFYVPRQFPWAAPMLSLQDRIMEELKKRDRRSSCGLLREIYQVEKCSHLLGELADSVQFPLSEEKEVEVRQRVNELRLVCDAMKEGLEPLERQVREVFHMIVRSRTDWLDYFGSRHNPE
ncbi:hypothetical protein V6N11_003870 [Hibiscus sabdariffa]|uniref:Uncharacterized protein n=1 Tax=Hibiscus sabdariffa TaxID=183260 RepID=A0ABR2SFG6_9ROSI